MSCFTETFDYTCDVAIDGGVEIAWITDQENVTAVSVDSQGIVTAITVTTPADVFELPFEPYTAIFNQNRASGENLITRSIEGAQVMNPGQDVFEFLQNAKDCRCPLVMIHTEHAGRSRIWGHEDGNRYGVRIDAIEHTTGATLNDINQVTISFTAPWKQFARTLSPSVTLPLA
jgi:hypothetical protein